MALNMLWRAFMALDMQWQALKALCMQWQEGTKNALTGVEG
jgi:hypothetical protein